ncbi:MAG: hypothetical protein PHG48_04225, partial [Eubacteriales bacterium]|nr:hypothetical protein [Eubacteriales bacterium]
LRKNNKEGAGEKKAAGVTAARKSYNLLYIRDATDAVYKAAGDFANGIYNITGKEIVGHEELGEIIAEIRRENNNAYSAGDAPGTADTAKTKDSSPGAAFRTMKVSVRAASELAWHPVAGLQTSLEKCIKWYYSNNRLSRKSGYALSGGGSMPHEDGKNRKSGAAGDNAGAGAVNLTDETDQKTGISGELLRYAENIIFFALAVLLMQYQSDKSIYFAVDFMALYIIIIGIFFGIKHSIPAAVLAGLYSILSLAAQGIGILSLLYNLSVTVSIIEYLVIGVSIGYVVERKNNRISELLYETRLIQDDLVSINRLYEEVSEVKNEYEYRIYQYSDSYGRIYAIIRQLESLVPEEVFVNALKVVRELLGEEKISIYVADEKGLFIRRIAGGAADGAGEHALPASMRLKDKPEWKDIIDKKEVYANSFLDAAMPSVIAPVVSGDRTAAVIVIENMEFEKLNLYYINLMKVLTNLLASAFSRAQAYENEVYKKRYVDGTLILKPEEYKKSLLVRDKLVKEGSYMYSIIKINDLTTRDEKIEAARKISALIRKGDELAFNDNEELLLLLPSTSPRDAVFVKKKLDGAGLSCEITGNEV